MIMWQVNKIQPRHMCLEPPEKIPWLPGATDASEGPDGCRNMTSADNPPRIQNPNRPLQTPKPQHLPNEEPGLT